MTWDNATLALEVSEVVRNVLTVLLPMEVIPVSIVCDLLFNGTHLYALFTLDLSVQLDETKCH